MSNSVISKILIHDHHKIVFLFNFMFRQASYQEQHEPVSPVKKLTATKVKTPIKMKPRPQGVDFEEIDVRKILKPLSHSKYIKVRKLLSYWADLYMFSRKTNINFLLLLFLRLQDLHLIVFVIVSVAKLFRNDNENNYSIQGRKLHILCLIWKLNNVK